MWPCKRVGPRVARFVVLSSVLALAGLGATAATSARGGALDRTFDGDGKAVTDFSPTDSGHAVVVEPDGKIVVAGGAETPVEGGLQTGFALARYLPNGSLDPTFGSGGKVVTRQGSGATSIVREPNGRYVVAGYDWREGAKDLALARLNRDGSLDTSFGGGFVYADFGGLDAAYAVLLQPDGRVLVVGVTSPTAEPGRQDIAMARFSTDGTLDASFGGDGTVVSDLGGGDDVSDAALGPNGSIVVAGSTSAGGGGRVAVTRFNADGSLDAAFDGDGTASPELSQVIPERATGVEIQPDGKIVVGIDGNADFAAARLLPDGRLDSSFGTGGVGRITAAGGEYTSALALQPNGKLLLGGLRAAPTAPDADFGLGRLLPDGRPDRHFGQSGVVTTDFGADDSPAGLALEPGGRIAVVGTRYVSRFEVDVALARYLPGTCSVPRLAGATLAQARGRLTAANCRVRRVSRALSQRVPAGRVVGQRPRAGRELADWARVDLVVSRGRRR